MGKSGGYAKVSTHYPSEKFLTDIIWYAKYIHAK